MAQLICESRKFIGESSMLFVNQGILFSIMNQEKLFVNLFFLALFLTVRA